MAGAASRTEACVKGGERALFCKNVHASPAFEAIFEKAKELGLHMLAIPRELGGMNAPLVLYMMNSELMARADASTMTHFGFHGGIALALLVYSIHEGTTTFNQETLEIEETRFVDAIQEIMMGEAWGSMDITEPNAGSDMAALRTRGFQDEDGNWFVTGQKIFITSGHGKYHIVIARTEDSDDDGPMAGLKGLSTFLVRGYEDTPEGRVHHVTVDRLEEKLGHHASPTCSVIFENAPAELIGERGEGFKHMLLLMNNARIGVGFECLGLCEAAHRLAVQYASERSSMGKTKAVLRIREASSTDPNGGIFVPANAQHEIVEPRLADDFDSRRVNLGDIEVRDVGAERSTARRDGDFSCLRFRQCHEIAPLSTMPQSTSDFVGRHFQFQCELLLCLPR